MRQTAPSRPPSGRTTASDPTPPLIPVVVTVAIATVLALLAVVASVVVGGAAEPAAAGLTDPGPVMRWGLPIVRAVHDLSAALTVGLLLLAAIAVPDRTRPALLQAARMAVVTGTIWVVAGLVGVVLGFADIAGISPTSSGFLVQFQHFVWGLEVLRKGLISAGFAAVAVTLAFAATKRVTILWAGIFSVIAILPLALAGHAASTVEHETAVNALAFHLVGSVAWVGGLGALWLLRPALGTWLPVVAQRYSTVAAWSMLTVGLSGVVSAAVRMSGPGDLGTAYGALILAKVAGLAALGLLGLTQRRRVLARLQQQPQSRALFARLVATELAVMGLTVGVATALARTGNPNKVRPPAATLAEELTNYPLPPAPHDTTWITAWRWDWLWGTVCIVAVALYLGAVVRLHRRGDRWPIGRTICWVLGFLVLAWSTCGAPGIYGRVAFSWHMTSHMSIAMLAPILLVLAAPLTLVMRVEPHRKDGTYGIREILLGMVHSKYVAFWANPVVAALNFVFGLLVFYYTPLFELALVTHTGHVLMVVHFLLSGYLFAMVLVGTDPGPPKWSPPLRLVVLFATMSFHAFFGISMMALQTLLAGDFFRAVTMPWVPDLLEDQRVGGMIAWGIGDIPALLLAMLLVLAWLRADDAEARRHDRQADRDHDADLAAYNAQLAVIAERDRQEGY